MCLHFPLARTEFEVFHHLTFGSRSFFFHFILFYTFSHLLNIVFFFLPTPEVAASVPANEGETQWMMICWIVFFYDKSLKSFAKSAWRKKKSQTQKSLEFFASHLKWPSWWMIKRSWGLSGIFFIKRLSFDWLKLVFIIHLVFH